MGDGELSGQPVGRLALGGGQPTASVRVMGGEQHKPPVQLPKDVVQAFPDPPNILDWSFFDNSTIVFLFKTSFFFIWNYLLLNVDKLNDR